MPSDHPIEFAPFAGLPVPTVRVADDGWQVRFLATPLLQRLSPRQWQQLLQGLVVEQVAAGTLIVEVCSAGDDCYLLQSGRARVHAGLRTLAVLEPGTLFGEDALITGGTRNASVSMLTEGRIGRLSGSRFERWFLNAVIQPLSEPGGRVPLSIDSPPPLGGAGVYLPLSRIRDPDLPLSRDQAYCVVGGGLRERWLAAFVLAQQGFDILPLEQAGDG